MDKIREKKGYICDMDGVIYHGNRILPGVVEFVNWLYEKDKKFLFLTNNSGKTPRQLHEKLAWMGLPCGTPCIPWGTAHCHQSGPHRPHRTGHSSGLPGTGQAH